jgi:hypothetical protein
MYLPEFYSYNPTEVSLNTRAWTLQERLSSLAISRLWSTALTVALPPQAMFRAGTKMGDLGEEWQNCRITSANTHTGDWALRWNMQLAGVVADVGVLRPGG